MNRAFPHAAKKLLAAIFKELKSPNKNVEVELESEIESEQEGT